MRVQSRSGIRGRTSRFLLGFVIMSCFLGAGNLFAEVVNSRVLGLGGAENFRDFGGYETMDGHFVKSGLLYRSNELARLTGEDYAKIDKLNVNLVVDFRSEEERAIAQTRWQGSEEPRFLEIPLDEHPAFAEYMEELEVAMANNNVEEFNRLAVAIYAEFPLVYAAEYAEAIRELTTETSLPVLMHCVAGKDRTGVAAALILSFLNVPRGIIIEDYLLTNKLMIVDPKWSAVKKLYWGVEKEWIDAVFATIDQRYGNMHNYFMTALGFDDDTLQRIRNNLLE